MTTEIEYLDVVEATVVDTPTGGEAPPVTPAILSAAEVARRLCPADRPDAVTEGWVKRRLSSGRWPSTKVGRIRGMTEAQFQRALDLEANEPYPSPTRSAVGLSPRTRHKRTTTTSGGSAS